MNNIARDKSKLISRLVISLLVLVFLVSHADKTLAQNPVTTAGGTIGRIPKWTATDALGNSVITELPSGNIGIGTTNPDSIFHVVGSGASIFSRSISGSVFSQQSAMQLGLNGATMLIGGGPSLLFFSDITGATPLPKQFMGRVSSVWENATAGSEAAGLVFSVRANTLDTSASTERMRITSAGNVGVGINNPANFFHVAPLQSSIGAASQTTTTVTGSGTTFTSAMVGNLLVFADGTRRTITGYTSPTELTVAESGTVSFQTYTVNYIGLNVNSIGNVGIGTTNANLHLTVKKDATGDVQVRISSHGKDFYLGAEWLNGVPAIGTNNFTPMTLVTDNAERFRITPTGNVGIGTTSPAEHLQIGTSGSNYNFSIATSSNNKGFIGTSSDVVSLGINRRFTDGVFTDTGKTHAEIEVSSGNADSKILFLTASTNNTLASERMRIDKSGNVGIGTSTPASKLDVSGNTNVNGNISANGNLTLTGTGNITAAGAITGGTINAKYQDIAEWVPSHQAMTYGTVVVLDPERSNHVITSSQSYDTTVAGIVSDGPGVILGEAGEGKLKIATTGRVKVKVDATNAPIRVGDLLVTSTQEGMAMRSEPLDLAGTKIHRPGTIIGKALEPLPKGKGEILVLLSMQ